MIINIMFMAIIIAGIAGIYFCLDADKRTPKAKPLALAFLLMIAASTIAILVRSLSSSDEKGGQVVSEELFYSRASGFVLGRHLARTSPGFNALIVAYDKTSENALADASLEGLREGLGGKVKIAAIDSPVPIPSKGQLSENEKKKISPEKMLYFSRKMQPNNFDQLIAKYPECNLIISFIGLPKDANKMAVLNKKAGKGLHPLTNAIFKSQETIKLQC